MNKYVIVSGIVVLLICGGLSGCNEQTHVINNSDNIEIISYNITTNWIDYDDNREIVSGEMNGFYHDYPRPSGGAFDTFGIRYVVSGSVKNVGEYFIDSVNITTLFLDSNGDTIAKSNSMYIDLPKGKFGYFYITLNRDDTWYFDEIVDVKVEIS